MRDPEYLARLEADLEQLMRASNALPGALSTARQDATTDAVERLLQLHGFGPAPDGLQGPSKTRRPFPRDTSTTPTQPATEGAA